MDHLKNITHVSKGKATKFPLYITCIRNQPDTDFHSHEFVELVLIQNGSASHRLTSGETPLQRGDIFVIPRGKYHGYLNGSQLDLINILYIPEMLPMAQLDAAALRSFDAFYKGVPHGSEIYPSMHLPEEDFQILEKAALELYEENSQRHSGYQFNMMGLFMNLLCRLARLYTNQPDIEKNVDELGNVIAYIHSNFRRKITIEVAIGSDVEYTIDDETTNIKVLAKGALAEYEGDEKKRFAVQAVLTGYFLQLNDMLEDYYDYIDVEEEDRPL